MCPRCAPARREPGGILRPDALTRQYTVGPVGLEPTTRGLKVLSAVVQTVRRAPVSPLTCGFVRPQSAEMLLLRVCAVSLSSESLASQRRRAAPTPSRGSSCRLGVANARPSAAAAACRWRRAWCVGWTSRSRQSRRVTAGWSSAVRLSVARVGPAGAAGASQLRCSDARRCGRYLPGRGLDVGRPGLGRGHLVRVAVGCVGQPGRRVRAGGQRT